MLNCGDFLFGSGLTANFFFFVNTHSPHPMPSKTKKALKKAISRPQPPSVLKPTHSNPSSSSSSSVVMLEPTPEMLAKLVQDNDDEAVLGETSTFMEALDNDDQQITMNPEFSFEFGGGGILENAAVSSSSWNFTEAKAAFGGSRQRVRGGEGPGGKKSCKNILFFRVMELLALTIRLKRWLVIIKLLLRRIQRRRRKKSKFLRRILNLRLSLEIKSEKKMMIARMEILAMKRTTMCS